MTGYRRDGWKCQSIRNVGFNIKLNANNVADVLTAIDNIVIQMLTILNISQSQIDALTFASIKYSSVDLTGTVTPPDTSSSSIISGTSTLSGGLSGASLGGFPVTSSSVVSNGVDSSASTSNMPLIIGLAVGIPLFASNSLFI